MKMKPEERPTVIALGSITAVVLTYVIFSTVTRMQNENKPTTPATSVTNASLTNRSADGSSLGSASGATLNPNSSTYLGTGNGTAKTKTDLYGDIPPESPTFRDPFRPVTPPVVESWRTAPPPVTHVRPPTRLEAAAVSRPGPAIAPMTVMPSSGNNPPMGMMPGVVAAPTPEVILAGVITGPSAVAVLHVGDHAYELMPGEKMPLNLALLSVTENGVYVRQGKKTWFIEVGRSLSAAIAIQPDSSSALPSSGAVPSVPSPARQQVENDPGSMPAKGPDEEELPVTVSNDTDQ